MKSIKRNIALFLSIAMIAGFMVFPAIGADPEPAVKGLDEMTAAELQEEFNITASADTFTMTSSNDGNKSNITIDFDKETIYWADAAPDPAPAFVSFDKGGKWSALKFGIGASATEGEDFSKFLNKESEIWLTTALDSATKQPQKAVSAKPATDTTPEVVAVDAAVTWKFGKIAARPKLDKFSMDYATCASADGTTNGQWTLKASGTQKLAQLQIAYSADGKNVAPGTDEKGAYGLFPTEAKTGINVTDPTTEGKADKVNFLVRVAPTANSAGSKAKKFAASSLIKAPTLKVDYKKEALKLKAGLVVTESSVVKVGDGDDAAYPAVTGHDDVGDAVNGIPFTGLDKAKHEKMIKEGLKIDGNEADVKTLTYGKNYGVYAAATEKKPASAVQVISIADYSAVYEADATLTIKGATIALPKAYEAKLLSDAAKADVKWANKIKATKSAVYVVRMKNTAKFDAKKNTTSGNVVSGNLLLDVLVGKDAKNKDAVLAATYIKTSGTTETASAAEAAVYIAAKDAYVKLTSVDDAEKNAVAITLAFAGETEATAYKVVNDNADLTVAIDGTLNVSVDDSIIDAATYTFTLGLNEGTDEKFYAPEIKVVVTPDNATIITGLKALVPDAETLATGLANDLSESAAKTVITDKLKAIFTEEALNGASVDYEFSGYKAPVTDGADGSIKVTVNFARGDKTGKVDVTVALPASAA